MRRAPSIPAAPALALALRLPSFATIAEVAEVSGLISCRFIGWAAAGEVWKGDTFQSAATQTDDNGTKRTVRAQRTDNGIDVQRT